jgi:hypothetical protein
MSPVSSGSKNTPSKKSARSKWQAERYIPEDITLHNHRCENLKSYMTLTNFIQNFSNIHCTRLISYMDEITRDHECGF